MTHKQIARAIRHLGLTVRYSPEYAEWRIDYKRSDTRWTEDTAYFTTWPDDALETARIMAAFKPASQ
jgi:hypothetical protein